MAKMNIEIKASDLEEVKELISGLQKKVEVYEKELDRLYGERYKDAKEEFDLGDLSDGYHTFNELYHHRMILFSVICNGNPLRAWKSWKHHDGTMYDDYFIVGIETIAGQYTYHYHKDHWSMFRVRVLDNAPEWDGHKPEDITRLLTLV